MQVLSFEGKGFEYFKIWIVNILLTAVTLGIYYPWAKVRNRRYLYANSTLDGRNFEYHATGKQLFIGYIISMVLLIAYVGLQNTLPTVSAIIAIVFVVALPWIIWRSLMFNMRVTSFSNVLFSFNGELKGSYFNYMLLPILFFVALYGGLIAVTVVGIKIMPELPAAAGLLLFVGTIATIALAIYLYAWMKKRNTSYVINGTKYGQGEFETTLDVGPFVAIWFKSVGMFFVLALLYLVFVALMSFALGLSEVLLYIAENKEDPAVIAEVFQSPAIVIFIVSLYLGFILISFFVFSYSYVRQRNYIYDNLTLDKKITFSSRLSFGSFAWVTISNFILMAITLGLAIPWATVRLARLVLSNTAVDTSIGIDGYVTQQQETQSSLGEQIGDAFNVDVGAGF